MNTKKASILVVDDEINILKSLRRLFRNNGYDVHTAESGSEALNLLDEQSNIQLVLSDFRMPKMNGGELLSEIKLRHPHIVSMIISGYTDFNSALTVLNNGTAFKFLTKPWDNQNLLTEIDEALAHAKAREAESNFLGETNYLKAQKAFQAAIDECQFGHDNHCAMYFTIDNALDLKRNGCALDSILVSLAQEIQSFCHIPVRFFQPNDSEILALVPWPDKETMATKMSQLIRTICDSQWIIENELVIDLASSYFATNDLNVAQNYLYETLKEARVLLRSQEEYVAITEQYIQAKKRQLTIKSDVAKALNSNQFSLMYQPKVTMSNGLIQSAEVLLRWKHEKLGWISPVEFIEIAENDGQIIGIGDWVLKHGIAQLSRLARMRHDFERLSINVSVNQLTNLNIIDTIKQHLAEYQVDASKLVIEVTETSLIKNLRLIRKTLNGLKQLGVKIAIDDFGVGYSSFAYLSKLPIDILKIDRALIDDIEYNTDTQILISNLVQTCHKLNIEVVAEGIETQSVLEKVNVTKCDYVQGYFYSAPVEPKEIEHMLVAQPFRQ